MKKSTHYAKIILYVFSVFFLVSISLHIYGIRINLSESMPIGIWKANNKFSSIEKGQVVLICPPDTQLFLMAKERHYITVGICHSKFTFLLKPVVAVEGDIVRVDAKGIFVNNQLLLNSRAKKYDHAGRIMSAIPFGTYVVLHNTVWVISDFSRFSFDSRYFGAISVENVAATATLWLPFFY